MFWSCSLPFVGAVRFGDEWVVRSPIGILPVQQYSGSTDSGGQHKSARDYCVCVQAYHQIDEVVRQAVAAQHFEECRSRNGIKCLNQIDKRDISLKVMLLSLSQCHEEIESTIDGPSLWTKSTLILWSVLLHDFFQPLYHHARQEFGRNIQKTYAAPVLRLSKVSLFGQKNQLGFQPFRITDTSVVRTVVKLQSLA